MGRKEIAQSDWQLAILYLEEEGGGGGGKKLGLEEWNGRVEDKLSLAKEDEWKWMA